MLGQHPELYGFPELGIFAAEKAGGSMAVHGGRGVRGDGMARIRPGLAQAVAELGWGAQGPGELAGARAWLAVRQALDMVDVYDALLDQIAPLRGVEKTPTTLLQAGALDRATDAYPRACFLHLTRHPRTALRSLEEQFLHWRSVGLPGARPGRARGRATAPAPGAQAAMGDMGTTDGLPDMRMYGSTAPATAAQVIAAGNLIKATDASLARYASVQKAFAAGYTYVLKTNGEEHLLYNGPSPGYAGLHPKDPSSLVYAINVPHHAPILLGAMYIENGNTNGPQVGGGLTRWHSHLTVCEDSKPTIAAFGVQLRGTCNPATWRDQYTAQMLHVWVVPYTGGPFSDDLSRAATNAAVRAVLDRR